MRFAGEEPLRRGGGTGRWLDRGPEFENRSVLLGPLPKMSACACAHVLMHVCVHVCESAL